MGPVSRVAMRVSTMGEGEDEVEGDGRVGRRRLAVMLAFLAAVAVAKLSAAAPQARPGLATMSRLQAQQTWQWQWQWHRPWQASSRCC